MSRKRLRLIFFIFERESDHEKVSCINYGYYVGICTYDNYYNIR